jgi:hypothetical protein
MRKKIGILISISSIIIAAIVIMYYYPSGGYNGLIGASWILAILGAPTTLLDIVLYKFGISRGLISDFIWICFFYLIQYQLIAVLFYKKFNKKIKIIFLFLIFIVIVVSASITWQIIMGKFVK